MGIAAKRLHIITGKKLKYPLYIIGLFANMGSKLDVIKNYLAKNNYIYLEITDPYSVEKIADLLEYGKIFEPKDCVEMVYLGGYHIINKKNDKAIKYYQMAHDMGSMSATCNLAKIYGYDEKNHDMAMIYWLSAIERGEPYAMMTLGIYYRRIIKDDISAEKYLLMALEHRDDKSFDYLVALYNTNSLHIKKLALHIKYGKDRKEVIKLFNHIATLKLSYDDQNEFVKIVSEFVFTLEDDIPSSLRLLSITLKSKIELIDLHFRYTVGGRGYEAAKADFLGSLL